MKKFKIAMVLLFGMVSMMALNSCTKDDTTYYYRYDGIEEMSYIIGEEETVLAFCQELSDLLESLDGTVFTESTIKSKTRSIVNKYNYGVIQGTFYLQKSLTGTGDWTNVQSYTMTLSSIYTKGEVQPVSATGFVFKK